MSIRRKRYPVRSPWSRLSSTRSPDCVFSGLMPCVFDRLLHDRRVDLAVARERAQRGHDDVAIVDLEEVAQRRRGSRCGRTRRCRASSAGRGSQRSIESGSAFT